MSNQREDLEKKVLAAKSEAEVIDILKNANEEISAEDAMKLYQRVKELQNADDMALSLDELDAVSGGVTTRNWSKDGCAATVEKGSNCWGTDGGCSHMNIKYTSISEGDRCAVRTTHPCKYEDIGYEEKESYVPEILKQTGETPLVIPITYQKCIYCGRLRSIEVWG